MSAAEKLKAHQESGVLKDAWAVLGVLPQIVAVVEAAETDLRDGGRANARALAASLAALDEALTPKAIYSDASGKPFEPQPIREPLGSPPGSEPL